MNNLMTPQTLTEAMQYSEMMAKSQIIPKDYQGKPENVLVAVQWGHEIGLPPLQAMQNIAVINGRPSLWGDAMLALVRGSGKLEYIDERIDENGTAICRLKRKGEPEQIRTFGEEDAKLAGLLNKPGPWTQNKNRMKQMRARGFALRDVFTDVLKGMAVAEEVQDAEFIDHSNAAPVQTTPVAIAQKPASLLQEVGELLTARFKTAEIKQFAIDTLELPADADLSGKWMQQLTDDDLNKLKARVKELDHPQLPLE